MKSWLPKGSLRITRSPETFIYPIRSKRGFEMWKLVNERNRSLGVYLTDSEAKDAAVLYAKRLMRVPKYYKEKYAMKLASYERMREEMLARAEKDEE